MHWFIVVKSQESRNLDVFEFSKPGSKINPFGHNNGGGGGRRGGDIRWDEVVAGFNDAAFVGSGGFSKLT